MTKARESIINVSDTPYYHIMGRCVRRAFLCGVDNFTGRDYSHRKQWIVDKVAELSAIFMIDVCAYAVMSNHYHLVLKINLEQAKNLSDDAVIERWIQLFAGNELVQRYLKGECHTQAEKNKVSEIVIEWRNRLSDISWFMRCLNETIARQANEEDKCTGRFWEGRFKSQALLNEQALLSCMAYVDLNPIRAGLADSVDTSDFTSIEKRITSLQLDVSSNQLAEKDKKIEITDNAKEEIKPVKLADFVGSKDRDGIAYLLMDYLELVDWTGRKLSSKFQVVCGKESQKDKSYRSQGCISDTEPKILDKLGFTSDIWLKSMNQFSEHSYSHIGTSEQLRAVCDEAGKKWIAGAKLSRELYQ